MLLYDNAHCHLLIRFLHLQGCQTLLSWEAMRPLPSCMGRIPGRTSQTAL